MAVRVNGTASVPSSLQTDITTIRNNVATILTRVPGSVALNADMQTLLARVTGVVALDADMQTLLARVTATRAGYFDFLNIGGNVASQATMGANTDAATDPSAASGTVFSKIRGAGDNLDSILSTMSLKPTAKEITTIAAGFSGTSGSFSAYAAIIASTAIAYYSTKVNFSLLAGATGGLVVVQVSIGGAGAEVVIGEFAIETNGTIGYGFLIEIEGNVPAGSRLAWRAKTASSNACTLNGACNGYGA